MERQNYGKTELWKDRIMERQNDRIMEKQITERQNCRKIELHRGIIMERQIRERSNYTENQKVRIRERGGGGGIKERQNSVISSFQIFLFL